MSNQIFSTAHSKILGGLFAETNFLQSARRQDIPSFFIRVNKRRVKKTAKEKILSPFGIDSIF